MFAPKIFEELRGIDKTYVYKAGSAHSQTRVCSGPGGLMLQQMYIAVPWYNGNIHKGATETMKVTVKSVYHLPSPHEVTSRDRVQSFPHNREKVSKLYALYVCVSHVYTTQCSSYK